MPNQKPPHIAVVDDDPNIRALLRRALEPEGFRVSEAAGGEDLKKLIAAGGVDLVTLDLGLPGEDGLTIAREVRAQSSVAIVMVTGKGDTIDRIVGLEIGADDYITKPFHVREVLARIRTVLRRAGARPSQATAVDRDLYTFTGFTLDTGKRELRSPDGMICDLTTAEFNLLWVFVQHPNRVLSRDQLMDLLQGHDRNPLDRTIDNQVSRLRRKIEGSPPSGGLIKTIRGAGYLFTAEVKRG